MILGKESALRPSESNKSSEQSTPVSCEDKPISASTETFRAFNEPDVIASTKFSNNGTCNVETDRPIAPPRRRRPKQTNISIDNNGTKTDDSSNVCIKYSIKLCNCLYYLILFLIFVNSN